MYFSQKVVLVPLPSRWFIILAFVLCILFFVILLHILVDKCNKYWRNEISDSEVVDNQEAEEQHSFFNFYIGVIYIIVISFILFVRFSLHHLLSLKISLLLNDSRHILHILHIPIFYLKIPGLRHYIWKNILRRSTTVQPENDQMELQSI